MDEISTGAGVEHEQRRWERELHLKEREMTLKERDDARKDDELRLRRKDQAWARITNPVIVAIISAAFAAMINGYFQRLSEERKFESERILEAFRTGDSDEKKASAMAFLIKLNLISDAGRAKLIEQFLLQRPVNLKPRFPALDEVGVNWIDFAGAVKWPPNAGFASEPARRTLVVGSRIDQYGPDTGVVFNEFGAPYDQPSLPYKQETLKYTAYVVARPIEVDAGVTAPWFRKPGGAVMYKADKSAGDLVKEGALFAVTR